MTALTWPEAFRQDLRLATLRALDDVAALKPISSSLLYKALIGLRHTAEREQFLAELPWLAERGLVALDDIPGTPMREVRLLDRGRRAARGEVRVDGVAEPSGIA